MSEMLLKLLLSNVLNQLKGGQTIHAIHDLEVILRGAGEIREDKWLNM